MKNSSVVVIQYQTEKIFIAFIYFHFSLHTRFTFNRVLLFRHTY